MQFTLSGVFAFCSELRLHKYPVLMRSGRTTEYGPDKAALNGQDGATICRLFFADRQMEGICGDHGV